MTYGMKESIENPQFDRMFKNLKLLFHEQRRINKKAKNTIN